MDLLFLTDGGRPETCLVGEGAVLDPVQIEGAEATRLDFSLAVPEDRAPSYRGECVEVAWGVRVSTQASLEGGEVEYFPVTVLPAI